MLESLGDYVHSTHPRGLRLKSLMVIDDCADLRELLAEHFAGKYLVRQASDAVTGCQEFLQNPADLILTDINMPGMSGIELIERIRAAGHETPVIFMTGYGDKKNAIAAIKLRAWDFIEKPSDLAKIDQSVVSALNQHNIGQFTTQLFNFGYNNQQLQILKLLACGYSNKDIAQRIFISEKDVKYHVTRFLRDFAVDNRRDLQTKLNSGELPAKEAPQQQNADSAATSNSQ